jgi:thiol:disulfide interchange protein DsbA
MLKVFRSALRGHCNSSNGTSTGGAWVWTLALTVLAACGSPSQSNGTTASSASTSEAPAVAPPAPPAAAVQETADSPVKTNPGGEELVLASTAANPATTKYQAGQDYKVLATAQGTTSAPEKVEVAEVFWYGCPHCFNLDPKLQDWVKKLPPDVSFVRIPVMWSTAHEIHARLYYTAMALNKLTDMHDAIFREIHVNNNKLIDDEHIQALFAKYGVGAEQFQKAFRSFTVEGQLRRAKELTLRYEIRSVPILVVNGKYTTDAPGVKSVDDMFAVVNELVAKERQKK